MSSQDLFQYIATILFVFALIHTFIAGKLTQLSHRFKQGSVKRNILILFGEVEIVFGLWSALLVLLGSILINFKFVSNYLNNRDFTDAIFVFVVMSVCSTKPIIYLAEKTLVNISHILPINNNIAIFFSILFLGPLLGSFITGPAAMTICALLLMPRFFTSTQSRKFKYATLALLFINISIGGMLTPYASTPVLVVASKWNWDLVFMLKHFGIKTILTLLLNTICILIFFKDEVKKSVLQIPVKEFSKVPTLISIIHLIFLFLIVLMAHQSVFCVGLFLYFLGFMRATKQYQSTLALREPLLVGFFLAGLIVIGGLQSWWLGPIISRLTKYQLYFSSIGLTAFTDNAALTYLGSLVTNLDFNSRIALVSGSVVGGGLTLIANAPNPAGFGILRKSFEKEGFSSVQLFLWALPLTIIAALVFIIM
jgi:MFS family permease